jgi:hypothetical protein
MYAFPFHHAVEFPYTDKNHDVDQSQKMVSAFLGNYKKARDENNGCDHP